MKEITSRQNAKYKSWLASLDSRGIKKSGRALIFGEKLVAEFLAQNPQHAEDLLYPPKIAETVVPEHVHSYRLNGELFNSLDVLGTKSPLLLVRTPEIQPWPGGSPQGLELIVALSDPGNLGALLRSAEAFGVTRVILTPEACSPFLPRTVRASAGAAFRTPLMKTDQKLAHLKIENGYALDMNGEDLAGFKWPDNIYLVLGEEGRGISQELKLKSLSIPMHGKSESLNAMVAASIALYSYNQHTK